MLYEKIQQDLTDAQKRRDSFTVSVLRMVKSELGYVMVDYKGGELPDEEVIKVLRKEVKKRQESIEAYTNVGHPERAEEEAKEMKIIEGYLPQLMTEEQIKVEIEKIADETGLTGGPLVGAIMSRLRGKADGSVVSRLINSR